MPDEDLDQILEDLKNDDSISSLNEATSATRIDINEDNINDYIMQKVGRLVETGIETVEAIQQTVASGFTADELQAFSGLMSSVTSAAETLNKINLQNKKAKATKEVKQMDIDAKKQLSSGSGNGNGGDTNILIATREEIIEQFLEKNSKVIEAAVEESEPIDDE